jgi:Prophage minor tail protein Z (GPZ)
MPIALTITPKGFEEAEKILRGIPNAFPKAAAEAINRGLIAGRKVAVQGIRTRYNIKASAIKGEGMKVNKASWTKLDGTLESKGPMLPVSLFSPIVKTKRIVRRGARRQFVTVMIIKGNRKLVKGAFASKSGKIFERRQEARYPIFPVSTIGVPFMIGSVGVAKKVQETIAKVTTERLEHNVALFLSGGGFGKR